jgi:hypothetical protein
VAAHIAPTLPGVERESETDHQPEPIATRERLSEGKGREPDLDSQRPLLVRVGLLDRHQQTSPSFLLTLNPTLHLVKAQSELMKLSG